MNYPLYLLPIEDGIDQISCKDWDTPESRTWYLITGSSAHTDAMLIFTLLLFKQKKKMWRKLTESRERAVMGLSAYPVTILCVLRILEFLMTQSDSIEYSTMKNHFAIKERWFGDKETPAAKGQ